MMVSKIERMLEQKMGEKAHTGKATHYLEVQDHITRMS